MHLTSQSTTYKTNKEWRIVGTHLALYNPRGLSPFLQSSAGACIIPIWANPIYARVVRDSLILALYTSEGSSPFLLAVISWRHIISTWANPSQGNSKGSHPLRNRGSGL